MKIKSLILNVPNKRGAYKEDPELVELVKILFL
jgi:hypothetical protein